MFGFPSLHIRRRHRCPEWRFVNYECQVGGAGFSWFRCLPFIDHETSAFAALNANISTQFVSGLNSNLLHVNTLRSPKTLQQAHTYRKANTAAVNSLPILKCNANDIVVIVGIHSLHPLLMKNLKP